MSKKEKIELDDINDKRNPKKSRKKKKGGFFRIILKILLILVILIIGFITYSTIKNGWGLQGILQTALGQDKETLKNLEPLTLLIMGVSKDIDVELTDTIMIASYNPKSQKAVLMSIPRDTFTGKNKNKAVASEKINALYQKSPQKTVDAVNNITGLNIQKYVVIDNKALIQLVDEIGGVEFDVPMDMEYDDVTQDLYIHLDKGYQKLDGEQAEQLVRFRKNNNGTTYSSSYGDNDAGRMRTQREFLKAVFEQTFKVKNITKIGGLIDIFKQNVKTNITNWDEIKYYIPYAINFSTDNLENVVLPGENKMLNKLWFFEYDKQETEKMVNELFLSNEEDEGQDEDESSENNPTTNVIQENESSNENKKIDKDSVKIEILNGSNSSKKLTEVSNILKSKGYNISKTGTTTTTSKTTILNKAEVEDDFMEELKNDLKIGILSNSSNGKKDDCDITIIIGKDYN